MKEKNQKDKSPQLGESYENAPESRFTGGQYKNNYIYAGAMNLAWNELSDNIIKETIQLKTDDPRALKTLEKLNHPTLTKQDLDEASYYIKSGFGQKTVEIINSEAKQKFPEKSFQDLELQLSDQDIIAYAYLLKKVTYQRPFTKENVLFENTPVQGFYAANPNQKQNIRIVQYFNDDQFIIQLNLQQAGDELYLAKGYPMTAPDEIVQKIVQYSSKSYEIPFGIDEEDTFQMPTIDLDYSRDYKEIMGKSLANKHFRDYFIQKMFENIKFTIDEQGARVENEAVISMVKGGMSDSVTQQPKHFLLNKPFWIIMKKNGSPNPYFILGVNNTEFMKAP